MPTKKPTSPGTIPPKAIHANLRQRLLLEQHILSPETVSFGLDKLTTEETAHYIGVRVETLRDRVKRASLGICAPYHLGKKMFWRRSELDRWIETKRSGKAA